MQNLFVNNFTIPLVQIINLMFEVDFSEKETYGNFEK